MESYCLKCKNNTENIDPEVSSTSNGRLMIISKCAICGSKNSFFYYHILRILKIIFKVLLNTKEQKDYSAN